jgi:hypothetical protein
MRVANKNKLEYMIKPLIRTLEPWSGRKKKEILPEGVRTFQRLPGLTS